MEVYCTKVIIKLYQWKEYGHEPVAYERREEEHRQNTRASWKADKEIIIVEHFITSINVATNKVKTKTFTTISLSYSCITCSLNFETPH